MLLSETEGLTDFSPGQAGVLGNLNRWFKPELRFTVLPLHMDMHPRFFT